MSCSIPTISLRSRRPHRLPRRPTKPTSSINRVQLRSVGHRVRLPLSCHRPVHSRCAALLFRNLVFFPYLYCSHLVQLSRSRISSSSTLPCSKRILVCVCAPSIFARQWHVAVEDRNEKPMCLCLAVRVHLFVESLLVVMETIGPLVRVRSNSSGQARPHFK